MSAVCKITSIEQLVFEDKISPPEDLMFRSSEVGSMIHIIICHIYKNKEKKQLSDKGTTGLSMTECKPWCDICNNSVGF